MGYSLGMEACRCHLHALHVPHSRVPVYLRGEFLHASGALVFVGAARGQFYVTWLWWPVGLTLAGPTGLVTNRESS